VLLVPGFSESGRFTELLVKPLPVTLNSVTVNTPVPLLLNCIVCEFGSPTVTFPKFTLEGVMVTPACTALADTGMTALDPCELVTVTLPVTVSADFGLNAKLIAALFPGASVTGVVIPVAVTSFAFTLTCEIVMFEFPLFVTVTLLVLELPAVTLPKLTLDGLAEIVTDAAIPEPLNATAFGEFGALLAMDTLPLRVPAVAGANSTLNVAVLPAAIVAGVLSPLAL
jgi:hypothetical protein